MGYRSDVAYVIVFETVDKRDSFVELMRAKNNEHIDDALKEVGIEEGEREITFRTKDAVKWYENFPDVRAHENLLKDARELFDATTRFIRIGEETDDVEDAVHDDADWSTGEVWELLDISRSIVSNF
jgi:hypothetical protein